jgi:hypothetical protein
MLPSPRCLISQPKTFHRTRPIIECPARAVRCNRFCRWPGSA